MKLCVASVGDALDSLVAKHFEHSAWHLFVDAETLTVHPVRNLLPHDHHAVLLKAASENVRAVIAGKFSPRSLKRLSNAKLAVAFVHGITVHELARKILSGEIEPQEMGAGTEPVRPVATLPRLTPMKGKRKPLATSGFASDSARGHHHLQQYGGRGH